MNWTPRLLAENLEFPEGPIALPGGDVVFTEIRGQRLSRYRGGRVETIASTGGGANGATLGPDGCFYVANNGGISSGSHGYWIAPQQLAGRIQRVTPDGVVSDVTTALPGDPPHRPNDLCFGPDGLLYFTDPHNWEDIRNLKPGRVNRTDLAGHVEQLAEVRRFPNGIGFGLDGRLYVAECVAQRIWAYDWSPERLGPPELFCTLPAGYPDGFCFNARGELIVCGSVGDVVCVFDPGGKLLERWDAPKDTEPTNCCIGEDVLYMTLSGSGQLIAFDYDGQALPLYPDRR
jgi:gluconolactonase